MKKQAILIGIDEYKSVPHMESLRGAEHDAKILAKLLRAHYGFKTTELLGSAATKPAMMDAIDRSEDSDALLVYFAGHGREQAGQLLLMPADDDESGRNSVSLTELRTALPIGTNKVPALVIVNACSATAPAETLFDETPEPGKLRGIVESTSSLHMIAATEYCATRRTGDSQHGRFSADLMAALQSKTARDIPKPGWLQVLECWTRQVAERKATERGWDLKDSLTPEAAARLRMIKARLCSLVDQSSHKAGFYSYTDHWLRHTDSLVGVMNAVIPREAAHGLTPEEVFVLLCAAYLHDVGHFHIQDKVQFPSEDSLRTNHGRASAEYLRENRRWMVLTSAESLTVQQVCLAHTQRHPHDIPAEVCVGSHKVRPRLVAAILRLADALDVNSSRITYWPLLMKGRPSPPTPRWWLNRNFVGIQCKPLDRTIIVHLAVNPDADANQLHAAARAWANEIEQVLTECAKELIPSGIDYQHVEVILGQRSLSTAAKSPEGEDTHGR